MNKTFNREIRSEILSLAEDILNNKEIEGANLLSEMLLGNKEKRMHAIAHIRELIGTSPKRPVYYWNHEIIGLPSQTRHVIRYAGDYIDQIIKYCSYEKGDFLIFKFRGLHRSLGQNLNRLKKVIPPKLIEQLTRFNEIIYVPAKHEWNVDENRPHLFSAKEAVFVCFIVKRLAGQIAPFSKASQIYNANGQVDYYYDSSQKESR